MKKWIMAAAIAAAVMLPAAVRAHEGHMHKALGTIAGVQGNQVEVKTTDGKVITVVLDAKTAVTRAKVKLDSAALKVGERVAVDYTQAKSVNTAKTIKLGETPAPLKK
jgi:hypothetical protein